MAVLVIILLIAACVAGTIYNHRNAAAALLGVEFDVDAPPRLVVAAITETFCGGAKAGLRSIVTGVSVAPKDNARFTYKTKHGDVGTISVVAHGSGSRVTASASELFVGNTQALKEHRSPWFAAGAGLTHGICLLLRVSPNAAKMKRFAHGLQPKLAKRLGTSASSAPSALTGRRAPLDDEVSV
jgi:hypothetical protein